MSVSGPVRLRLPATSANLGPGFDTAALALALYLEVDAAPSPTFEVRATGRNPEICGQVAPNLLLHTYRQAWSRYGRGEPTPLALEVRNGIPIGMGCGSSAASRLAGLALASLYGGFGWSRARILDEAAALEHHPDNAAACVFGGFTVAGVEADPLHGRRPQVRAVSFAPPPTWHALLALPPAALATTASRGVLPSEYPRAAIVPNLQNVALLTAAFARGDAGLLAAATRDTLHQPFRSEACPLLPRLLPLAGRDGILSVTLSGAGSGVLLLLEDEQAAAGASARVQERCGAFGLAEILTSSLGQEPAELGLV